MKEKGVLPVEVIIHYVINYPQPKLKIRGHFQDIISLMYVVTYVL